MKLYLFLLASSSIVIAIDQQFADYLQRLNFGKSSAEIIANVNVVNAQGDTPLLFAVRNLGDNPRAKTAIQLLKKSGADVNYLNPKTKQTALLASLQQEHPNWTAAETLLELGANPNIADENGITPLMVSASRDIYWMSPAENSLVHKLLQKGAKKDAKDAKGYTAADYADGKNKALLGAKATERPLPLPPLKLIRPLPVPVSKKEQPASKLAALTPKERQAYLYLGTIVADEEIVQMILDEGVSAQQTLTPLELVENLISLTAKISSGAEQTKQKDKYLKISRMLSGRR